MGVRGTDKTESEIQREIIKMAALCFPRVLVHHSPNAVARRGKGGAIAVGINKANGSKTGWPDLIFVAPRYVAFGEVKRRLGRATDPQLDMLDTLSGFGFPTSILRSAEQAYFWLRETGAPWSGIKFVEDDERVAA